MGSIAGVDTKRLTYLYETDVPRHPEIERLFGEPVCTPVFMQKPIASFPFKETALEVELIPAETYTQGKSTAGRVAALGVCREYIPGPRKRSGVGETGRPGHLSSLSAAPGRGPASRDRKALTLAFRVS